MGGVGEAARLALHLVHVPVGHCLEQRLKRQQQLSGLGLLEFRLLEQIEKVLLECGHHILTELLRVFTFCFCINAHALAGRNIHLRGPVLRRGEKLCFLTGRSLIQ